MPDSIQTVELEELVRWPGLFQVLRDSAMEQRQEQQQVELEPEPHQKQPEPEQEQTDIPLEMLEGEVVLDHPVARVV